MKRETASWLTAALIFGGFALLGVSERVDLAAERDRHRRLVERATALGVAGAPGGDGTEAASRMARRQQESPRDPAELAKEVAGVFRKLKSLSAETDQANRDEIVRVCLASLEELMLVDPETFRKMFGELAANSGMNPQERSELLQVLLGLNAPDKLPVSAELFLQYREQIGAEDRSPLGDILDKWAANDPAAAFAWLGEHPDLLGGDSNSPVLIKALTGAASRDPAFAFAEMNRRIPNEEERRRLVNRMASRLQDDTDRTAFFTRLRLEDSEGMKRNALEVMGQSFSSSDSGKLNDWLKSVAATPEETAEIARGVTYSDNSEPGGWMTWLSQALPPDEFGERSQDFLNRWIQNDYRAAGEWIDDQNNGPLKEQAVGLYAQKIAVRFPENAADWAMTLPAGSARRNVLGKIHDTLAKRDPAAAEVFAEEHGLVK